MKKILKLFPITIWALFTNLMSAILYFANINEVLSVYNFIGINSVFLYNSLDILRKIILFPVFWEILLCNRSYKNNGEWLIPQYEIKYELLVFLLLDLIIFFICKKLLPLIKSKNHDK